MEHYPWFQLWNPLKDLPIQGSEFRVWKAMGTTKGLPAAVFNEERAPLASWFAAVLLMTHDTNPA